MSLGQGLCCKEAEGWAIHPQEGSKQGTQARGRRSQVGWGYGHGRVSRVRLRLPPLSLSSPVHPRAILSFQGAAPWGELHCMERCSQKALG